jgi:hypothetical protein
MIAAFLLRLDGAGVHSKGRSPGKTKISRMRYLMLRRFNALYFAEVVFSNLNVSKAMEKNSVSLATGKYT